jgi:hypothetical protein
MLDLYFKLEQKTAVNNSHVISAISACNISEMPSLFPTKGTSPTQVMNFTNQISRIHKWLTHALFVLLIVFVFLSRKPITNWAQENTESLTIKEE